MEEVFKVLADLEAEHAAIREQNDYRLVEPWMQQSDETTTIKEVEGELVAPNAEDSSSAELNSVTWLCRTNVGNRLTFRGNPVRAKGICYRVYDISWQAGAGWPVYSSYCPQPNYSAAFRFRDAKRHQIVPVFGGFYWVGCDPNTCALGNTTTDIVFWVNDDIYGDNTGTFKVTVTSVTQ